MEEHIRLNNKGETLFLTGDYDGAQAAFFRAIDITPTYTEAHNNLGILFLQKGDINKAIHHLQNALTIDPLYKPAIMNLCLLLINNGDLKNAVNICMSYLKHFPNDTEFDNLISGIAETEVGKTARKYINILRFEDKLLEFLSFIEPFIRVEIGRLYVERIGHMAIDTDYYLRRRQLLGSPANTIHIFLASKPANQQLLDMFKKHLNIIQDETLLYIYEACEKFRKSRFFAPILSFKTSERGDFVKGDVTLKFTEEEEEKGRNNLNKMGICENDWFVCIYARDSEYTKRLYPHLDTSHNDHRNADIETFRKAIDYIIEMGGFVIRMGSVVKEAFNYNHDRFIDYSLICRNDFMDIYLSAKCKYFLGCDAGIVNVASIFNVPVALVNYEINGIIPHYRKDLCLYIPKITKRKETDELLPFSVFINEFDKMHDVEHMWRCGEHDKRGYSRQDNTPEEIFEVAKEMLERLNGTFLQTDHDKELINRYYELYSQDHAFASLAGEKVPLGRDFLRRYEHLIC
jgi:putative glycosyltransferase (TIGR04372 family)